MITLEFAAWDLVSSKGFLLTSPHRAASIAYTYNSLDFCGPGNCVNSCDAKAECDPAGWGPQYVLSEACPLNVCCSQFGFCGTTPEFCGDKVVTNPSCPGGSSASGRNIGYYEGWAITRPCDVMLPATIPWIDYTHINFAFATIDPVSFQIVPSSPTDPELYLQLTSLKSLIPGLQVSYELLNVV